MANLSVPQRAIAPDQLHRQTYGHRIGVKAPHNIRFVQLPQERHSDVPDVFALKPDLRRKYDFSVSEVDSLDQLSSALAEKPEIVLLDNMGPDMLRDAVRMRNMTGPGTQLEASGGVTLETVRRIAETGVDRISVGALTHSAPALDIALDYQA